MHTKSQTSPNISTLGRGYNRFTFRQASFDDIVDLAVVGMIRARSSIEIGCTSSAVRIQLGIRNVKIHQSVSLASRHTLVYL